MKDGVAEHVKAVQLACQIGATGVEASARARKDLEGGLLAPESVAVAARLGIPPRAFDALLVLARSLPATEKGPPDDGLGAQLRALRDHGPALPAVADTATADRNASQATIGVPEEVQIALNVPQNRVGRYVLLGQLGAGGMGIVYRAWDPSLARVVALKMLRGEPDRVLRERFLREGRAAARLRHPGIVGVHDVGEEAGLPYLAMDLLSARTLSDSIAAIPPDDLRGRVALLREVAEAVGHAHALGIVHRDLKPENVLLDAGGRPVVTDFGLAKELTRDDAQLTQTGAVLGTPRYMSPEQAGGIGVVGPAGDVFSLGVMLYEAIAGQPPFDGVSIPEVLAKVIDANPQPPSRFSRHVTVDLEAVCLKALEKEPTRRYADARALAADLGRWIQGEPVEARPVTWGRRVVRLARRHRWATLVATASLLAVATTVSVWAGRRARAQADVAGSLMRARQAIYDARQSRRVANHAHTQAAAAVVEREIGAAIATDPSCAPAYLERGRMKALLGLHEEARADLDRAVALAPASAEARIERGRLLATLYRRGIERASTAYVIDRRIAPEAAAIEAADPPLRALREAAEADLSSVEGAPASDAERELTRAYLACVRRRWDDALEATSRALSMDLSEEACWLAGLAHLGKDEPDEAIPLLDRAVLVGAGFGEAWLARSEARFRRADERRSTPDQEVQDDLAQAIADAERATLEGADPAMARIRIAQTLWMWGEVNRARSEPSEAQYRRGIDLLEGGRGGFDDVSCLYLRGALWDGLACASKASPAMAIEAGKMAIALMEQVVRRDPTYRSAFVRLGHAWYDLAAAEEGAGEDATAAYEGAIEAYTRGLAQGEDWWARLYRGNSLWWLGWRARQAGGKGRERLQAAIRDFDPLHAKPPDLVTTEEGSTWATIGLEDADEGKDALPAMTRAEEEQRRSLATDPQFEVLLSMHGEMLLLRARAEELAGRPFEATCVGAAAEFAATLAKKGNYAEALLGPAHLECALARADRAARRACAERFARAFEALRQWRPCDGEGLAWLGEPFVAVPFAETLLLADAAPADGWNDLARFLACAHAAHPKVQRAARLVDLAFAALDRTRPIEARAIEDDPLLAGLHGDPRWDALVGPR